MISTIFAPYRFYLSFQKFSKSMWLTLYLFSYAIITYYTSWSGHSTETALIRLKDQILKNMDNDEVTGLVCIAFRNAFDVIDHELLSTKLFIYGATPSSVASFKSYLSERKQFISLGKTTSKQLKVKQGVP